MKPRRTAIVVTRRPELRVALRVMIHAKFRVVETMPEFIQQMIGDIRLVIIDRRDSQIVATKVTRYLVEHGFDTRMMFITARLYDRRDSSIVIQDGKDLMSRLRWAIPLVLARKRGPKKGSHRKNVRSEEIGWNSMRAVS